MKRWHRHQLRQSSNSAEIVEEREIDLNNVTIDNTCANVDDTNEPTVTQTSKRSVTCQTDECVIETSNDTSYFMCNLNDINGMRNAEVQVNIILKRIADKSCEANIIEKKNNVKDFSCGPLDPTIQFSFCRGFHGIHSLKKEEHFSSLTGVSNTVFTFLLNSLPDFPFSKVSKRTKLLITLMKLKTGVRYSALGVMFQLHRTSISKIFTSMISVLYILLKNFILSPSKSAIQANIPEAFKANYSNTRVIIDCTEVHTETPFNVRQRVLMYSDYKRNHTAKFLVGCTPCGLVSFISKCYGGRASDSFITNDCGIINLLETGDVVLADKGFPAIRTSVGNRNAIVVLPPFFHTPQFSAQEVEDTYNIASVRIHIERVNQRIKNFHILDKISTSLFPSIDHIVYSICALVNMENPIIKQ